MKALYGIAASRCDDCNQITRVGCSRGARNSKTLLSGAGYRPAPQIFHRDSSVKCKVTYVSEITILTTHRSRVRGTKTERSQAPVLGWKDEGEGRPAPWFPERR